ncbi:hypothetical protein [Yoonia sp. SS1-5]|uniref:Uncharacterized protein n=1 Tax=Yoonia rhodophyticola TaxID=3137370 RepID=A0AAN0NK17_9RHOB
MAWDQSIHFGLGHQRGGGTSGFHRNGSQASFSGIVYRGSKTGPGTVFTRGFVIREAQEVINGRQQTTVPAVNSEEGTTRGVISTGLGVTMASHWAAVNRDGSAGEGWVYCIVLENYAWAAEGERNMTQKGGWTMSRYQGEIMLRGPDGGLALPGSHIYAARPVKYEAQADRPSFNGIIQRNVAYANGDPMADPTLAADAHFRAFCGGTMPAPPDMMAAAAAAPAGLPD